MEEALEQLRDEHGSHFREACEGPVHQISVLEDSISELQRSSSLKLAALRQQGERVGGRTASLEEEVFGAQARLAAVDRSTETTLGRASAVRAQAAQAKEALERDCAEAEAQLERARKAGARLAERLRTAARARAELRRRMHRETSDARTARARRKGAAEHRILALRGTSPSASFGSAPGDFLDLSLASAASGALGGGAGAGRAERLEAMSRENQQLKRYMSEHRLSARHLHDLGGQMQRSLASMEGRASNLRQHSAARSPALV